MVSGHYGARMGSDRKNFWMLKRCKRCTQEKEKTRNKECSSEGVVSLRYSRKMTNMSSIQVREMNDAFEAGGR